jgi:hypothetical protein
MHSILVLFVLEEFFQTEAEREYSSDRGQGNLLSGSLFALARGQGADTLEIIWRKLFCVLSGAGAFMLPHDPLETDQWFLTAGRPR